MGRMMEQINNGSARTNIARRLKDAGFKYENYVLHNRDSGMRGWQRPFTSGGGLYCTYVYCDLNRGLLDIYKEYDCGGEVAQLDDMPIPREILEEDDADAFMEWLDGECEYYLDDEDYDEDDDEED